MQNTEPMNFAWSWSALAGYELCPAKFKFDRENKPEKGDAANFGQVMHKAFENYVRSGTPLPLDMRHHLPFLDKIMDAGPEPVAEQRLAIDRNMQPCDWLSPDTWCRAVIDFVNLDPVSGKGILVDYKTGKPRPGFGQVELQAAILLCHDIEVESFLIGYYWTQKKELEPKRFTPDDVPAVWAELLPRVNKMEENISNGHYPEIENYLCGRYCANTNCKFNGRRSR